MQNKNSLRHIVLIPYILILFSVITIADVPVAKLFVDKDTLTLYFPDETSINDISLEVRIKKTDIVKILVEYSTFEIFAVDTLPAHYCLRLKRNGSTSPLPQDCNPSQTVVQNLADSDIFWYSSIESQRRSIRIKKGDTTIGLCVAGQTTCKLQLSGATITSEPVTAVVTPIIPAATQEIPQQDNSVFDPLTGHTKVYVPEGDFSGDNGSADDAFWIDKYEVSNDLFLEFINARGIRSTAQDVYYDLNASGGRIKVAGSRYVVESGMEQLPVIEVTWYGAHDYCEWVDGRLPTATEWLKAALWHPETGKISPYPWGDTIDFDFAVIQTDSIIDVDNLLADVSPIGAVHMAGNVSEWVEDHRGINYHYIGASYNAKWRDTDIHELTRSTPGNHLASTGFRCVYDE